MALKTFNPTSPGRRQLILVDRSELWKGKPVKSLTEGRSEKAGRNNHGRVTARRRGGGHKHNYRLVDFKRRKMDMPATVERLEYDPNRTAFIALIKYEDGEQAYILAPQRLGVGDKVIAGKQVDVKPGNAMPLERSENLAGMIRGPGGLRGSRPPGTQKATVPSGRTPSCAGR